MARPFNVLFVEDDPAVRSLMREVLHAHGFVAFTAADPYEALCVLMEHHVDLLLTDIVMPGMSGFELAQQAKLIRPDLRVLYMTGYAQQAAGRDGPRHGKLLEKPVRPAALIEEIHAAMAAAG